MAALTAIPLLFCNNDGEVLSGLHRSATCRCSESTSMELFLWVDTNSEMHASACERPVWSTHIRPSVPLEQFRPLAAAVETHLE